MDYLTTKQAAEKVGLEPGELLALARKCNIDVPRFGHVLAWTEEAVGVARKLLAAQKAGTCPECGKRIPWLRPEEE